MNGSLLFFVLWLKWKVDLYVKSDLDFGSALICRYKFIALALNSSISFIY